MSWTRRRGRHPFAAVFLALSRLQEEFPRLAENYARTALTEGQLVKVKPSDFVYEYMGVREEIPINSGLRSKIGPKGTSQFFLSQMS